MLVEVELPVSLLPHAATPSAIAAATADRRHEPSILINPSFFLTTAATLAGLRRGPVTDVFPTCEKAVKAPAGSGSRTRSGYG